MNFTREQEITVENFNYSNLKKWIKCFSHKDKVEIAVYSAELVIDLYNGTSDTPKLAIQAAKDWLLNSTKENKDKCLHAASNAASAYNADAAYAAYAAYADANANAADAAYAVHNYPEIKGKVVDFILSLIDKEKKELVQESKQAEIDSTAQQVESLSKESEYDKGMRECVKDIARIIGLNFPANVGYGNLADEVKASIDLMDHKLERAIKSLEQSGFVDNGGECWKPPVHPAREKLIKALGYTDHHLSIDGLIERVAEMKEELDKALLTIGDRDIEDALDVFDKTIDGSINESCPYSQLRNIGNMLHNVLCSIHDDEDVVSEFEGMAIKLWEVRKPLTLAQKQQKIDEQNGKKFYDIQHDIADVDMWDAVDIEDKHYWIEFAKKVSFKGKLESI